MLVAKMLLNFLFIFVLFFSFVLSKNEDYIGYKVYNVKLINETQQDQFYKLKTDVIDFWRKPCVKHGVMGKAMVPPDHADWFEQRLMEIGVEKDVYIEDVHTYLSQKEQRSNQSDDGQNIRFDYDRYHRYDAILDHLYALRDLYTNSTDNTTVDLVVFQQTDENRPLVYLKLTNGDFVDKPVAIVEANINPRDWITVPSALNVVEKLLEGDRSFLDDVIWIVVPVLNPDGYEYTHTNMRLWTKNRSLRSHLGFICPGVHLDRNFAIDWLVSDSSSSPCSHLYAGINPASEIETQMIQHLIEEYNPTLYISLQNSGRFITYPWRYEKAASGLFRRHHIKGIEIVDALEGYTLDSGAIAIGDRESGTSVDFARVSRVFYTFNIGVDYEDDGVTVPEENIRRVADDVWRAVVVAARNLELN